MKVIVCFVVLMLCSTHYGRAQNKGTFSNALQAADANEQPAVRLKQLSALESRLGDATPAEMVAYDEALLKANLQLNKDTNALTNYINLGLELTDAGRYDEAHNYYMQALSLADRMRYTKGTVKASVGLGFLYKSIGEVTRDDHDFAQAMHYYDHAGELIRSAGLKQFETQVLENAAQLYDIRKQPGQAIPRHRQVIELNRKAGNKELLPVNYMNLGISLKNDHQYEASLHAYQTAKTLMDSLPANKMLALALDDNMAILYYEMGDLARAEALAKDVYRNAEKNGIANVKLDILNLLGRISEQQNNFPQALKYTRQAMQLKDTLLNREKASQIAAMRARYEAVQKDERIASQLTTITQSRQYNRYLWLSVGALLLIGLILYIGQRRARKLNQRILLQQSELQSQKAALQQSNEIKDRLFSVISHDLRMPVNSLTSFTVLMENAISSEKLHQYTALLKQIMSDTATLLENLLHFAQTQMNNSRPALQAVSISDVADEVIQLLQPAIDRKSIRISHDIPADLLAIADPAMLALIFRNLISNALKFSYEGSGVTVSAGRDGEQVKCIVRDEGIGLSPDMVAVFNDPNGDANQIYTSTEGTRKEKGSGLGLMLCKTYAGMMNGTVTVISTGGKGSAFIVTLPGNVPEE